MAIIMLDSIIYIDYVIDYMVLIVYVISDYDSLT